MTSNEMALMANIAVDMQKNEVNVVLNKMRAEIEDYVCNHETNTDKAQGMLNALQILDKYRKEQTDAT